MIRSTEKTILFIAERFKIFIKELSKKESLLSRLKTHTKVKYRYFNFKSISMNGRERCMNSITG